MEHQSLIEFHAKEVDLPEMNAPGVRDWIHALILREDFRLDFLNFIFCSDKYLHEINLQYLDHDTYTDIITFDNSDEAIGIEGDIFISLERVAENAAEYKVDVETELLRVMAHGVMHLCGYDDKSEKDIAKMRRKENEALDLAPKYIP